MKPCLLALAGLLAGGAVACLAQSNVTTRIDAGLWEVTSTMTSAAQPNAAQPPGVARRCLTSAEAAKGAEAMLLDTMPPDCKATRSTIADGKLDALLQCAAGTSQAMTIAIKASFAPKSYEAVSDIAVAGGGTAMRINVTAKWVGACSS